ncbi:MAG TPA: PAS-domain containing protein [Alphaproteobacteria bacterium]|nr:PAS-domain containing protein [Alphaproteobacteria bacterium]
MFGSAALTLAVGYLCFQPELARPARWWTGAFLINTVHYAFMIAGIGVAPETASFLSESMQVVTAILLLEGTYAFLGRTLPVWTPVVPILAALGWAYWTAIVHPDFLLLTLPLYLTVGAAFIATGLIIFAKRRANPGAAYGLSGLVFILIGLHKLDYPFLRPIHWFAPWGFALAQLLAIMLAVALVFMSLGRQRITAQIAERRAADMQTRLVVGIEGLGQGFAYFDTEDRLILSNAKYREFYADINDLILPGAKFETMVRAAAAKRIYGATPEEMEAFVQERLERHRHPRGPIDQTHADGRILNIIEQRTPDGGTVAIWTDVTEERQHERAKAHLIGASTSPERMLRTVAEALSIALNYRWSGVVERYDGGKRGRMLTVFDRTAPEVDLAPIDYDLDGTPCGTVAVVGCVSVFRDNVASLFPQMGMLRDIGARSYIGMAFSDAAGEIVGHVFAINDKPDPANVRSQDFLALLTQWVATEFHRRAVDDALRHSESRLRDVAESSSDWFWELDQDLRFSYVSSRYQDITRIPLHQVMGRSIFDVIEEFNDADGRQRLIELYKARLPYRDERFSMTTASGERRHFSVSAKPIFREDGAFAGYRGTGRDITAEVGMEAEARYISTVLQAMLDHFPAGVAVIDRELKAITFNAKFLELLDYPKGRFKHGEPVEKLFRAIAARGDYGPGDPERLALERVERLQQTGHRRVEWVRPNGTVIGIESNPLPGFGYVTIYTDITQQKRAEADLRAALNQAELASRTKSEFLANMSHELRTPLNAIIGFSEIMKNELFGPIGNTNYADYARDIHESGIHLLSVINDILDVSKAEAGKIELHEEEVDVGQIVEASIRYVRDRATALKVRLENELPEGLPTVRVDPLRLKQVLLNLLSNSVKFTPEGGDVTVSGGVSPAGEFVLAIVDTGIGIAPEDMARVLEPFGQVDSTMHRRYEGTGLGLPLAKALVELHGGTLALDSKVGVGTTVTVRLPKERVLQLATTQ